jgi:hypothetical protein
LGGYHGQTAVAWRNQPDSASPRNGLPAEAFLEAGFIEEGVSAFRRRLRTIAVHQLSLESGPAWQYLVFAVSVSLQAKAASLCFMQAALGR